MVREDISIGEILLFCAGIATAIGTLALAVTSYLSIQFAERTIELGKDNLKLIEESIKVSHESIEATKESIQTNKEIFVNTYRPWLDIRIHDPDIAQDKTKVLTTIEIVIAGSYVPAQGVNCNYETAPSNNKTPVPIDLRRDTFLPGEKEVYSFEHLSNTFIIGHPEAKFRDSELVFGAGTPATIQISCTYRMTDDKATDSPFKTERAYILKPSNIRSPDGKGYGDDKYHGNDRGRNTMK